MLNDSLLGTYKINSILAIIFIKTPGFIQNYICRVNINDQILFFVI